MKKTIKRPIKRIEDKPMTIKLKANKYQTGQILGALRLGAILEDWCAFMVQEDIQTFDTHSSKFVGNVTYFMKEIKKQTGVKKPDTEYASDQVLQMFGDFVTENVIASKKAWEKREDDHKKKMKKLQKTCKHKKTDTINIENDKVIRQRVYCTRCEKQIGKEKVVKTK